MDPKVENLLREMQKDFERPRREAAETILLIVGMARIEELLSQLAEKILLHSINSTKSGKRTLAGLIDLCWALGAIDKCERDNLLTLKKLRNDAAHKTHFSIQEEACREKVMGLKLDEQFADEVGQDIKKPLLRLHACIDHLTLTLKRRCVQAAKWPPNLASWRDDADENWGLLLANEKQE